MTNLENRFKMRPAGVLSGGEHLPAIESRNTYVSKKLIGDLKMENAILSWSFLDACLVNPVSTSLLPRYAGRRLQGCLVRLSRLVALTSIEQKIQRIKVWTTTRPADPIPNAK